MCASFMNVSSIGLTVTVSLVGNPSLLAMATCYMLIDMKEMGTKDLQQVEGQTLTSCGPISTLVQIEFAEVTRQPSSLTVPREQ